MPVDANSDADARRRPCVGVVLASVLGVSFLVGASQTAEASSPPERASTPPSVISTATLHVRSLDDGELRRHLSLRSRGLEFVDAAAGSPAPAAVLVVRPVDDGYALTVVLADGRAFDRRVAAAGEQAPRIVASALANLLAAIAEERVSADRRAVSAAMGLIASVTAAGYEPGSVSEVHLDPDRGYSLFFNDGGAEVILGWEAFDIKLARLGKLQAKVGLELTRVARVDMDLDRAAVVTSLPREER